MATPVPAANLFDIFGYDASQANQSDQSWLGAQNQSNTLASQATQQAAQNVLGNQASQAALQASTQWTAVMPNSFTIGPKPDTSELKALAKEQDIELVSMWEINLMSGPMRHELLRKYETTATCLEWLFRNDIGEYVYIFDRGPRLLVGFTTIGAAPMMKISLNLDMKEIKL